MEIDVFKQNYYKTVEVKRIYMHSLMWSFNYKFVFQESDSFKNLCNLQSTVPLKQAAN